jgi:hypothetical protein
MKNAAHTSRTLVFTHSLSIPYQPRQLRESEASAQSVKVGPQHAKKMLTIIATPDDRLPMMPRTASWHSAAPAAIPSRWS